MILTIYLIILSYFVLGAIAFYFINRKKERLTARKSWLKYATYFIIIHVLFISIVFSPKIFHLLCVLIILVGLVELARLFEISRYRNLIFFVLSLIVYLILSAGFFRFSQLNTDLILFSFLVLSIFDAFSQIFGQLAGKTKLFPAISPGKTVEGLAGGVVAAVASSLLLKNLTGTSAVHTLVLATGIVIFAFTGDMLASVYKRKYHVKDFSRLLPGHGGFLDRFDSLIAGGAFTALLELTKLIN
jgi:phosphatidate cytidylyltransferase